MESKMIRNKKGISLVSLIITIIVTIILTTIAVFGGLTLMGKAGLTKFSTELDELNLAAYNAYLKKKAELNINGEKWTPAQIYESVATGEDNEKKLNGRNDLVLIDSEKGSINVELPKYEGKEWYIALVDNGENLAVGEVVLVPGFLEDGKLYYTQLDVENGGTTVEIEDPKEMYNKHKGENGEIVEILDETQIVNPNYIGNPNIKEVVKAKDDDIEVPIPTDYDYVAGTGSTGLVVRDQKDNEWVWIPVLNPSSMYEEGAVKTLCAGGVKTTRWGKGATLTAVPGAAGSNMREPDMSAYYDKDANTEYMALAGVSNVNELATEMVTEFSNMIDSVIKYNGFWVGRYELGYSNGIVCKKGVPVLSASPVASTDETNPYYGSETTQRWYGLYEAAQSFDTESAKSSMIWGCQWDAMVEFMGAEADDLSDIIQDGTNKHRLTGQYNDKVKNIVDARTGNFDWTLAARPNKARAVRGGSYVTSYGGAASPSGGSFSYSLYTNEYIGARASLYIK